MDRGVKFRDRLQPRRIIRWLKLAGVPPLVLIGACASLEPQAQAARAASQTGTEAQPISRTPETPTIFPEGPVVTIAPGESLPFHATCAGAERFEWRLQGEGGIGDSNAPDVLYRAPAAGGRWAILSVKGVSTYGASPVASIRIRVLEERSLRVDAYTFAAGWMTPRGDPSQFIELNAGRDCRPGSPCTELTYKPGAGWAGIYWWPKGCGETGDRISWQRVRSGECAIDLLTLGGFQTRVRLAFWARGQKGGEVVSFQVGGQDILPIPARSTGPVRLEAKWKRYEIDFTGTNLTRVVGLFAWTAKDMDNPNGATFYLQDVQFEGD